MVLELLRKGEISQGKAVELLEISRDDLFDLMAKHNIPMTNFSPQELERQLKFSIHLVKARSFLKHTGLVSIGGDAVKEARQYDKYK